MRSFDNPSLFKVAVLIVLTALPLACREQRPFSVSFEDPATLDEMRWNCGTLFRLATEHATSGIRSLEVTFSPRPPMPVAHYSELSFADFDPNWSGRRVLAFDAFVTGGSAIQLALRIDDRENPEYAGNFNTAIPLSAGANNVEIPLVRLATADPMRPLNLRNILGVTLFLVNSDERRTIYFDHFHLE